ncbi:hypothetical protein BJI67_07445 [Acidihalobacter aeolianus]|uniref:KfrA N-terminal DNA-binding domain-containing protein n=2 Tax=Acidihalobacter aeolianus TaxID=2792603 RepID=A0A1D8K7H1_9GAMM|nr:hypothetical protein BJI67_07445 [Acidihalobacter aeolianus]
MRLAPRLRADNPHPFCWVLAGLGFFAFEVFLWPVLFCPGVPYTGCQACRLALEPFMSGIITMGRSGITLEQVESAVSALEARNEAVTYDAIRNELGSGGYSTIGKHLQTLRARTASTSPMTVEVPAEIAASLTATLGQLWQQAQSVAAQDVETLRRAANARVQTAEQDLEQLLRRLDSTLEELEQTQSALAQSSTEVRAYWNRRRQDCRARTRAWQDSSTPCKPSFRISQRP